MLNTKLSHSQTFEVPVLLHEALRWAESARYPRVYSHAFLGICLQSSCLHSCFGFHPTECPTLVSQPDPNRRMRPIRLANNTLKLSLQLTEMSVSTSSQYILSALRYGGLAGLFQTHLKTMGLTCSLSQGLPKSSILAH